MYRITKEKEQLARSLFLKAESCRRVALLVGIDKNTAWSIARRIKSECGVIYCQCGKVAGHKDWCGWRTAQSEKRTAYMAGVFRNISTLNIYIPSRPQYERPEIHNERETEISLLVNQRHIRSLDAPMFDGDDCGHTFFKSSQMTPFDLLCLKEEAELENKYESRAWRIAEWERWCERKKSAHYPTNRS